MQIKLFFDHLSLRKYHYSPFRLYFKTCSVAEAFEGIEFFAVDLALELFGDAV